MEQKYRLGTESGSITWDVNAMLKDIAKYPIKQFNVEQLSAQNNLSSVNAEYAMTTDVEKPFVVVCLCPGKDKLIDGSHRLYKAKKLEIKTVLCYYVPAPEQKKYIVDFNETLYDKIVSEF